MATAPSLDKPARLVSLDAYRGFVMLLMASGGLGIARVASHFPESRIWGFLDYEVDHVTWTGCSLWDLIQPSFMFMVGVAMPFSHASRRARGDSTAKIAAHVVYRAMLLILLGIFLRSEGRKQTYFTFEDVLTQIGLGYAFVYLLVGRGWKVQLLAAAAVLVGYWYLFYQHPVPGPGFDYASVGVPAKLQPFTGLAAHWNKNTNFAADFDRWFLNLFPREKPFEFNGGGYQTLNFVPSMATMIFGVMAGEWLRSNREPKKKLVRLLAAGAACLLLGMAVDQNIWPFVDRGRTWTLCPIVKRIWTPSWAVFSTGWTLWMLAAFFWLIEIRGLRRWAFPLVVVGMNSIAMYVLAHTPAGWVRQTLNTHLGEDVFKGTYGPIISSLAVLFVLWLACLWMYRRRVFVRI
jgi:heparan-alpha-glucosaminide N-acetyltransferase